MRISTTAALGVGTKTNDTYAIGTILTSCPITASLNGMIYQAGTPLFEANIGDGDHPLVLDQNEGFSIQVASIPGTGTWTAAIIIEWAEQAAY
jgi:hypothetical protein